MQFVNTTSAAGFCNVANPDDTDRIMVIVAKPTFIVGDDGEVHLDTDNPFPVELEDRETTLGIFPQDTKPERAPAFDVCCLGKAYAPEGRPATQMQVQLRVGGTSSALNVYGDRFWIGEGRDAEISEPEPFVEMPLTWQRAFGGTVEILIDADTPIDVQSPFNPLGKGWNPVQDTTELAKYLKSPSGFPVCPDFRPLPNIENPDEPIRSWEDSPKPVCFSTLPFSSPMYLSRQIKNEKNCGTENRIKDAGDFPPMNEIAACRAPDELLMKTPEENMLINIQGMTPHNGFSFRLPRVRFYIDWLLGNKSGTVELQPQLLMLLPNERRFYLVFKEFFSFEFIKGMERCVRLRMTSGWFGLEEGGV